MIQLVSLLFTGFLCLLTIGAQTREEKVRNDRKKVEADKLWIYNDLPQGICRGRKTGKPMLVVFRCIPCVECVKLDDDLIDQDKRVRPLLDKFVCVRIVSDQRTGPVDLPVRHRPVVLGLPAQR